MNQPDTKSHVLCDVSYIMCLKWSKSRRQWRGGCRSWGRGWDRVFGGDRVSVLETDGQMETQQCEHVPTPELDTGKQLRW